MISHKAAWKAAGRRRRSWPSPATGAEHCALDTPARSCADRDPGASREAWLEPLVLGNTKFLKLSCHQDLSIPPRPVASSSHLSHLGKRRTEELFIQSTPACQQGSFWFSFSVAFASHFWNYMMFIPFS